MTQRIAPNNNLPATHFIEVYIHKNIGYQQDEPEGIETIVDTLTWTVKTNHKTIAIFRIRENKLPTLHNF